jgi:hypothetical protein
MITGPYVTKAVLIPEHTEHHLDPDAYWNLDFDGTPLGADEPLTLLYAKVAFPALRDAQVQWQLEKDAHAERRRPRSRRPAGALRARQQADLGTGRGRPG